MGDISKVVKVLADSTFQTTTLLARKGKPATENGRAVTVIDTQALIAICQTYQRIAIQSRKLANKLRSMGL